MNTTVAGIRVELRKDPKSTSWYDIAVNGVVVGYCMKYTGQKHPFGIHRMNWAARADVDGLRGNSFYTSTRADAVEEVLLRAGIIG